MVDCIFKKFPASFRIMIRTRLKFYSTKNDNDVYKKYYQALQLSEGCACDEIRMSYLYLVKKYHPDNPNGDLKKFQEIDEAFRKLMRKMSEEAAAAAVQESKGVLDHDIRHTAPQHRSYLSYDGIGIGNPSQREKQYAKFRATKAADNVLQHRISKVMIDEKNLVHKKTSMSSKHVHDIKTKYGYDRLVEDLIQESISKGEFNNLSGSGKPLKSFQNINPYVDFVTHKVNQVLIDNGFTPEWITLQKEIREKMESIRKDLKRDRSNFGEFPLNVEDARMWSDRVMVYKERTSNVNKSVDKFNLIVPIMNKQMVHFDLIYESECILKDGPPVIGNNESEKKEERGESQIEETENNSAFAILIKLFSNNKSK